MLLSWRINRCSYLFVIAAIIALIYTSFAKAATVATEWESEGTIDRVTLVMQQIILLKNRLQQGEQELINLQQRHKDVLAGAVIGETVSKNILNKASLDILVYKSNLESIMIELTDCQQTIAWLEKNSQELKNQLDVLSIFGVKVAKNEGMNAAILREDLQYQQKLLSLEKARMGYLRQLQTVVSQIVSLKKEHYELLNAWLKSRKMTLIKQQQVKDELAYQEQQNAWLQSLNTLYNRISTIDPIQSKEAYSAIERDIFYANENANYAYIESLIARYKDQIQQMKLTLLSSNSISLLNETASQVQSIAKQISRLESVLQTRITMLKQHVKELSNKYQHVESMKLYIEKLTEVVSQYQSADAKLLNLTKSLTAFRISLDQALQTELSARQGLPVFELQTLIDLGKEMLRVPALSFQITKSLSNHLVKGFQSTSLLGWSVIFLVECIGVFAYLFLRKKLQELTSKMTAWRDKLNYKWLSLQWIQRSLLDWVMIANILAIFYFFNVPLQNYIFILYLSFVWLAVKSTMIIARLCLVETTHDTSGHDVRLYHRLKWIILIGGVITAVTVFVHLLPFMYELTIFCNRLFLLLLLVISLMLLRSWQVVPHLILSHMDAHHPYLQKSIRLIGILIPLLMFSNAIIGLLGYLNLIMTVSWYEGVFLVVLIAYLIIRGLLTDALEQLSRVMIQYVSNGWLWTEAFLKPLDKVLRVTLFFAAWTALFLLYGWDQQSPIVERLTRILNYKLASILNTTITPLSIVELGIVISIFYWTAKWTREFVYRLLLSRTKDLGIRNSIAIMSQYSVVVIGIFICLRVLGVDLGALAAVAAAFAFAVGLGLRDLANNFASGFLILLERPLRVGDIVNIGGVEGEVTHIGGRAVTVMTWDHTELVVPNTEIFNKSFTNWTARDNIVRTVTAIKIGRQDNPHAVKVIIQAVLAEHKEVLKEPVSEVYLKEMNDSLMEFELRYYVNIRQVKSRISVLSTILMSIWDAFEAHGIRAPHPQREIVLKKEIPAPIIDLLNAAEGSGPAKTI